MTGEQREPVGFIEPGRVGYEAYGDEVGWKSFNGDAMPKWDYLPVRIRNAWNAAAGAIESFLETPRRRGPGGG